MTLPSVHTAAVTYEDSQEKQFETKAVLDSELFKGTTWVDIKSVHDLVKTVDTQSKDQNKLLEAIHRRLAEFGTEHEGVWIYGSDDDEERQYRRAISNAEAQESRESSGHLHWAISGHKGEDPLSGPIQKTPPKFRSRQLTSVIGLFLAMTNHSNSAKLGGSPLSNATYSKNLASYTSYSDQTAIPSESAKERRFGAFGDHRDRRRSQLSASEMLR